MYAVDNKKTTAAIGVFDNERAAKAFLRQRPHVHGTVVPLYSQFEFDHFFPPASGATGPERTR